MDPLARAETFGVSFESGTARRKPQRSSPTVVAFPNTSPDLALGPILRGLACPVRPQILRGRRCLDVTPRPGKAPCRERASRATWGCGARGTCYNAPNTGAIGHVRAMTPYTYTAYGLTIISDFELPELLPLPLQDVPEDAVRIRLGQVPQELDDPVGTGVLYQAKPNEFLLRLDAIAGYYVTDGRDIVVEPVPGATDDEIRLFLLGSALGCPAPSARAARYPRKRDRDAEGGRPDLRDLRQWQVDARRGAVAAWLPAPCRRRLRDCAHDRWYGHPNRAAGLSPDQALGGCGQETRARHGLTAPRPPPA